MEFYNNVCVDVVMRGGYEIVGVSGLKWYWHWHIEHRHDGQIGGDGLHSKQNI